MCVVNRLRPTAPRSDFREWPRGRRRLIDSEAMRLTRRQTRDPEPVELAALADGSIAPDRRTELEARLGASSELRDLLAEQERAVALAAGAAASVEAPAGLRARIETQRRAAAHAPGRRRSVLVGAVAGAAAVAALAAGLIAVSSRSSGEHFRAALSATTLAPGAAGEATLTKTSSGWRIELDATGLPRAAGGRF